MRGGILILTVVLSSSAMAMEIPHLVVSHDKYGTRDIGGRYADLGRAIGGGRSASSTNGSTPGATCVSVLTENHPEDACAASADVVPSVRSGAIDECAISLTHPVGVFRVAQRYLPLEHIK